MTSSCSPDPFALMESRAIVAHHRTRDWHRRRENWASSGKFIQAARVAYDVSGVYVPPPHQDAKPRLDGAPIFDEDSMYGLAGEIVRLLTPWTESDPAGLYVSILAQAGLLISPGFHAKVGSKIHEPRLFVCTFGPTSSARKGTTQAETRMIFNEALPEEPAGLYVRGGINTAEGLEDTFKDLSEPRRLLAIEDEFGRLLTLSARDGNSISHTMRMLWDDDSVENRTRRSPISIRDAHLGMIVSVTREELLARLDQVDVFSGMVNRFLWVYCQRHRLISNPPPIPQTMIAPLAEELGARIREARRIGQVRRSAEGEKAWDEWYVQHAMNSDQTARVAASTARSESQQLRLQLIFAALDGAKDIAEGQVVAARSVSQYSESSAAFLFSESTGNARLDKLIAALRAADDQELHHKYVKETLFGNNIKTAEDFDKLERDGMPFGVSRVEGKSTGGRPPMLWRLERLDL